MGTDMNMSHFMIRSSHGRLIARKGDGEVLTQNANELPNIISFDVDEWRNNYGKELPDEVDILDIGYHTRSGHYEPPSKRARQEIETIIHTNMNIRIEKKPEKEEIKCPFSDIKIELDPEEFFLDDPGNGTPVLIIKGDWEYTSTYYCTTDTGEIDEYMLTRKELYWLIDQGDKVDEFRKSCEKYFKHIKNAGDDRFFVRSLVYVGDDETVEEAVKDRTGKIVNGGVYKDVDPEDATLFTIYQKKDDGTVESCVDITVYGPNLYTWERAKQITDLLNMGTLLYAKNVLKVDGYLLDVAWHIADIEQAADELGIRLTDQDVKNIAGTIEINHDANRGTNWESIEYAIKDYDENTPKKYILKQWYPSLPDEWKEKDIVVIWSSHHCMYQVQNNHTTLERSEVENNPEFWEKQ